MKQQELNDLIDKVNSGAATDEELGLYNHYLNHLSSGTEEWDAGVLGVEDEVRAELHSRIEAARTPVGAKQVRLWPRIAAVAAAVTAITLGVWLYYASAPSTLSSRVPRDLVATDIVPGKNTATITFDNGEMVDLNEEELSISSESEPRRGGSKASSEKTQFLARRIAESKTVKLSTPRGGTYQVVLPDGTRVWLNADSKIEFPSQFIGRERKIILDGEAYFEVSHNRAKPFIVQTDKQEVTVLGTHFNINAYPEEKDTRTTLLEGSVRVSSLLSSSSLREGTTKQPQSGPSEGRTATILKPNEQSSLQGEALIVKKVNADEIIAWKNGLFAYDHTLLGEVMRQAARWYDVKIIYADESLKHKKLSGSVTRYDNISGLLNAISYTTGVKFKIEGRTIQVSQ